jgi:hypothetical protein
LLTYFSNRGINDYFPRRDKDAADIFYKNLLCYLGRIDNLNLQIDVLANSLLIYSQNCLAGTEQKGAIGVTRGGNATWSQ